MNKSQNTVCDNYKWSASSAIRKASGILADGQGISPVGGNSLGIHTPPAIGTYGDKRIKIFDPQKDAYRNCKNCNKHVNYHNKTEKK